VRQSATALLVFVSLSALAGAETFTGTVADDACAKDGHASMRMGPTDAECTIECVSAHGVPYVLVNGKTIYNLTGQQTLQKFAGQRVRVVGTLDPKTRTIAVDSVTAAR
jgi:hypothetical protein